MFYDNMKLHYKLELNKNGLPPVCSDKAKIFTAIINNNYLPNFKTSVEFVI